MNTDAKDSDAALDALLRSRASPPPMAADFPARVIGAAVPRERRERPSFRAWMHGLIPVALPARAAYVFASLLLLGFLIGLNAEGAGTPVSPTTIATGYLYDYELEL